MGTKHLSYFKVENFKRFDSLEVNDIGQFNLIVGDNNVGKTSLLEALLFDDENYNQFLRFLRGALMIARKYGYDQLKSINYFDIFLKNTGAKLVYNYRYSSDSRINSIFLSKKLKNDLTPEEAENLSTYLIINNTNQPLIEISHNGYSTYKFLDDVEDPNDVSPYIPLISFNYVYASDLIGFFSKASLNTEKFEEIKEALRFFIPNLISIEINTAIIPNQSLLAIREKNNNSIQPLPQYGDGFIKYLRCLLEVELCENRRLMIDEIDTGIHYTRMKEFLKQVLLTAKNKNVQIFATTHSKECIEYYTQALAELGLQDSGRIIRLADTKNGIKAYTMNFPEFENALSAESEIR